MPSPFVQEVLVKSIFVTLSDAVALRQFHGRSTPKSQNRSVTSFRQKNCEPVFKDLVEKHAVFDAVVASRSFG